MSAVLRLATGAILRFAGFGPPPPPPPTSGTPGAPRALTVTEATLDALTFSWQPPTDVGSSALVGYRVSRDGQDANGVGAFSKDVPVDQLSTSLTKLRADTAYNLSVAAVNASGPGLAVTVPARTAAPVVGVPDKPTSVGVGSITADSLVLSWQPPASDGGSPITGYRLTRDGTDTNGNGPWTGERSATARSQTFTLLLADTAYNLSIAAINAAGDSLPVAVATRTLAPTNRPELSFDPTPYTDAMKPVFVHAMANAQATFDNNEFPLRFQGTIPTDSDRSSKASGLGVADSGKFWRAVDSKKCWVWEKPLSTSNSGGGFVDYGLIPAYTKTGVDYPNVKGYIPKNYMPYAITRTSDHPYGGYWRDRPPMVPRRSSDQQSVFTVENAMDEVRAARDAGWDAIGVHTADIGQSGGSVHWGRSLYYLAACEKVNAADVPKGKRPIYFAPQGDGSTSGTQSVKNSDGTINRDLSADAYADKLLTLKGRPGLFKVNSRVLMGPFGVDRWKRGITYLSRDEDRRLFWKRVKTRLSNGGMPVEFLAIFLSDHTTYMDTWAPIVDIGTEWGARDPNGIRNTGHRFRGLPASFRKYGKPSCVSVAIGDYRPAQNGTYLWYEGGGFDACDESWITAIDSAADMVQAVTWNDHAEGNSIQPGGVNGSVWLEYMAYWIEWFKTGKKPVLKRDVAYLAHRWQFKDSSAYPSTIVGQPVTGQVSPVVKQTVRAVEHGSNRTTIRNEINCRVDLKAAATIFVSIDGVVQGSGTAGVAGRNRVVRPLKPGRIRLWAERNGIVVCDVTSDKPVVQNVPFEDLMYRVFSSASTAPRMAG